MNYKLQHVIHGMMSPILIHNDGVYSMTPLTRTRCVTHHNITEFPALFGPNLRICAACYVWVDVRVWCGVVVDYDDYVDDDC